MSTRHFAVSSALLFVLSFTACNSGADAFASGDTALKATIDGTSWISNSTNASATLSGAGNYSIVGRSADGRNLAITLNNISAPGTYPLGVSPIMFGGVATVGANSNSWTTPLSGTAGSVTVTAVSATHISGTFSFVATSATASQTSEGVTGGSFDLPVTGTGTATVPEENGARATGTANGVPWNASAIDFGFKPAIGGSISLGLYNSSYRVVLFLAGFNGEGAIPVGGAEGSLPRRVRVFAMDGTNRKWGLNGDDSESGTFVVTNFTASRMKGTFNITVSSSDPAAGSFVLAGTFDIGFQMLEP